MREIDWTNKPKAANTKNPIMIMAEAHKDRFQNGNICDLKIWKIALSEEEIKASMNKTIIIDKKKLIGFWKLIPAKKNNNVLFDSMGKNNANYFVMNHERDFSFYDFIDFGCKDGKSIKLAQKDFNGGKGIGLDIKLSNVIKTQKAGYEAAWFDVTKLSEFNNQVRFAIMSHFLEHLSGYGDANKCLRAACSIAKDFVYIKQPCFDADAYLFSIGFKLYWSDWKVHPNKMTSFVFFCMLRDLLKEGIIKSFKIYKYDKINDSSSECIHTIESKADTQEYIQGEHPKKKKFVFNYPVFREIRILIGLNERVVIEDLENTFLYDVEVFNSKKLTIK